MPGKWVSSGSNLEVVEDNTELVSLAIKQAIRSALREVGERAVGYATDIVPVRTGNLRSSIAYDADDRQVIIGSDVTYASYVEEGTVNMRARPYLRPAIVNHLDEYRQIIRDRMENA